MSHIELHYNVWELLHLLFQLFKSFLLILFKDLNAVELFKELYKDISLNIYKGLV